MNITAHARERYVERIKGITTKREIRQYIAENLEIIDEHINKLFKHSTEVFEGQIGGDKTTKKFFLNGDICLVVHNDVIITIYILNYAFPDKLKKTIIDGLVEEITKLQSEINEESEKVNNRREEIKLSIDNLKSEIEVLQAQIEHKESQIRGYEHELTTLNKEIVIKNKILQTYAEQLLKTSEYKKELYDV